MARIDPELQAAGPHRGRLDDGTASAPIDAKAPVTPPGAIPKVVFSSGRDGFQADLKARVDAYFGDGKSRNANGAMVAKTAFWVGLAAALYGAVLFGDLGRWPSLTLWCVGGVLLATIGFNLGHDAIHGSFSSRPWLNSVLAWSFDVMGASHYNWGISHCFRHHTYTNLARADGDIEPGPLLRFYPDPAQTFFYHRFQHLYAWALYAAAGIHWVFMADWISIAMRDPRTGKRHAFKNVLGYLAGKAAHFAAIVGIPALVTPFALWEIAIAYVLAGMCTGFTLAVVFQLAHVVPGPEFPVLGEARRVPTSWSEHQLRTTANFGGNNRLVTFFVGGLDHQIEHHLFPKVCHIHYPALSPIVKACAEDHGLPYLETPTVVGALRSHWRFLYLCGRKDEAQKLVDMQVAATKARVAALTTSSVAS